MNVRAHIPVDKATFYEFAAAQAEGRFEFDRGLIVQQMTGGTGRHTIVSERFAETLRRQLGGDDWLVAGHARGVDTPETVRYPDVVVERLPIELDSLATTSPMLLVEVLSPSTRNLDLNVKPAEYTSLASLQIYVAAEQDAAKCYVWLRDGTTGVFPATPVEVIGVSARIDMGSFGVSIPLAEIYRGLVA